MFIKFDRREVMTSEEKQKIIDMKASGKSANAISKELSISLNTVKSFLRRNKHKMIVETIEKPVDNIIVLSEERKSELPISNGKCLNCGKDIIQNDKIKKRKFCSDDCKKEWWKHHTDCLNKKAIYEIKCEGCNKTFKAYGNKNRKYCSHDCYIASRFGGAA